MVIFAVNGKGGLYAKKVVRTVVNRVNQPVSVGRVTVGTYNTLLKVLIGFLVVQILGDTLLSGTDSIGTLKGTRADIVQVHISAHNLVYTYTLSLNIYLRTVLLDIDNTGGIRHGLILSGKHLQGTEVTDITIHVIVTRTISKVQVSLGSVILNTVKAIRSKLG